MAEGRFRFPKTIEEEELCVERAVPNSPRYKNKCGELGILEDWQRARSVKFPIVEVGGVFEEYGLDKVQPLTRPITEMDALTLNYWLSKFVQEVAKCSKDPYPPKTLYQIVCSIRRFLVEKNSAIEFNLFSDSSDKRFAIFRRILDAEMKDGTRVGVGFSETKRKRASQFVI